MEPETGQSGLSPPWALLPGLLPSLGALLAVRPAYLYDTRFDENLGMFYTLLLAVLGAAATLVALLLVLPRSVGATKRFALVAGAFSVSIVLFVLWIASHDGSCIWRCGPL